MGPTKGTFLGNSTSFKSLCISLLSTVQAARMPEKLEKLKKAHRCYTSSTYGAATAKPTELITGIFRDLVNIANCAKFSVDQLRVFGVTGVQSGGSPKGKCTKDSGAKWYPLDLFLANQYC